MGAAISRKRHHCTKSREPHRSGHVDDENEELVATAAFQPQPAAVAAARRFIRETLESWQLPCRDDLVSDAVLLTSELVTNAIVHAGTAVEVACGLHGADVEVSVLDRHPARTIPDPQTGSADRTSGRGLLLPGALSSSWGVRYAAGGKVVWFRLGLRARPDGAPAVDEALSQAGRSNGFEPGAFFAPAVQRGGAERFQGGYHELPGHGAGLASAVVAANAAYALIADEDGELRVGASAGGVAPQMRSAGPAGGETLPTAGLGTFFAVDNSQPVAAGTDLPHAQRDSAPRVQQVADRVAVPLVRAALSEHDRAWRGRMSFVAEASDLLAGTLDEERTIALAAQLVVPRLAAWCAVLLPDKSGQLELGYAWHADESRADTLTSLLNHSPPPQVTAGNFVQQWSLAVPPQGPLTAVTAELVSDPAWCMPLRARDRSLGVFVIGRPRGPETKSNALDLAEDLIRRVALALDNARLYSEQLQATRALQRSLLPPELPDIAGVDLAAAYQPAGEGNEVGGDFYDIFQVAGGRWRFAIGDVCGKGPEAAAVTGLTRHALRILAMEGHDIPAVLERLNALIAGEASRAPFVTLIHGEIIPAPAGAVTISLACAGHPLPLILRSTGEVQAAAEPQPLLGVLDAVTFRTDIIRMSPGDVLLCVTDGVTERRGSGRLLDDDDGLSRLLSKCSGLNAGAIAARIQRAAQEFGHGPPADDLALIVFRRQ
jgi:serine phosphatase RsbU (regulator of sigma subunit)/anti-sigma regulatory factor (Ser/Thr protein kinase)